MRDVIEMSLSQPVDVTSTAFIRAAVRARMGVDGLEGPPVELVQFHVFIHCIKGNGRRIFDFHDHEMKPGTVIWIRPGQVQWWSNGFRIVEYP